MTGPATDQQGKHPAAAVDLDAIEDQLKAAEESGKAPEDIKIEGDKVPERLRGKSVAEIASAMESLENAVKTSEQGRQELKDEFNALKAQVTVQGPTVSVTPSTAEPVPISREDLDKLYEDDPLKAIRIMHEQMGQRLEKNLNARLQPLATGSADSAEANARLRYPDEFALLDTEIKTVLGNVPDRSVMNSAKSWDDLIAYVRGQNIDKLFEHRQTQADKKKEAEAQAAAAATVGFSGTAGAQIAPSQAAQVSNQLDATQREIAKGLDMTDEDYLKWSKVG